MRANLFVTASVVTEESAVHGAWSRTGWVDYDWSRTVTHESSDDVRPLSTFPDDQWDDESVDQWADRVTRSRIGEVDHNERGTRYVSAESAAVDQGEDGETFCYATHVVEVVDLVKNRHQH